tara:strand:+ start:330 stop:713 length:384 start_codon:yes stop_codon:yes gene_type:complete
MVSKKEWYNCMTIAAGTIFIISIISYMLHIQQKQFEGLTMKAKGLPLPADIAENLKKQNDELDNELQIDKYRDQYEDIILNYEELYYLDTIKRMINSQSNKERRQLLADNALNVKSLDDTAKFIYGH